jgi:hypothetical protein
MLKHGFRKKFEDRFEAYQFIKDNSNNVEKDCDIGVYFGSPVVAVDRIKKRNVSKDLPFVNYVIRDNLGAGVQGVLNHADGKRYDSKSQYERAVRAKGCRIVGNDWNGAQYKTPLERGMRGDFNVKPALKDALQKVF